MYRFPRESRLLNKRDFDGVFSQAVKTANAGFVVLYRKNELGYARVGLAISKKMIPKAHERNRIKRLVREAFRKVSLAPVDMVFMARKGLGSMENGIITAGLGKIWRTVNTSREN